MAKGLDLATLDTTSDVDSWFAICKAYGRLNGVFSNGSRYCRDLVHVEFPYHESELEMAWVGPTGVLKYGVWGAAYKSNVDQATLGRVGSNNRRAPPIK